MTIKQTTVLLAFVFFVLFQFSLMIVRNSSTVLSVESVEAFFLVILFSLLFMLLDKEHNFLGMMILSISTAAGLGIYLVLKQFIFNTEVDLLVSISLLAGSGVSILAQYAIIKVSGRKSA